MAEKRRRRRRGGTRWLVRRETGDYGPFSEADMLQAMDRREYELGTMVSQAGTDKWQPAGVHAVFREHYAECQKRWAEAALDEDVAREERKLRTMDKVKGGAGTLIVVGLLVVVGLGSWIAYRMLHAEPTGILAAVVVPTLPALPGLRPGSVKVRDLVLAKAVKVRRRREAEFHDTSGVRAEGKERKLRGVLDLNAASSGLKSRDIQRIKKTVQRRLMQCVKKAVKRGSSLKKVNVSYIIQSGRLGGISLNHAALKNGRLTGCVKRAVKGTRAPVFKGPEKRVRQGFRIAQ
jgi:hypothetical protein